MKLALLAVLLLAAPACAADAPSAESYPKAGWVTAGVHAAWVEPEDASDSTWNPGIQARYHVSPLLAVEGLAEYQRQKFPDTTAHTVALQASLLGYLYRRGKAAAYVLGGAGYYPTRVNGPDYRRNFGKVAPHAGGGAQLFLNDIWSVSLDYRHLWLGDLDSRTTAGAARTFKRSGEQIAVGVHWRLLGRSSSAPSK